MEYEVFFGKEAVGKVWVTRQGLYYRFVCRCRLSGDVVCRLAVRCADREENLGVVVPEGDGFGLDKCLPVKKLGDGPMTFFLMPKSPGPEGQFIPLCPEEPFAYIARLKDAFLARQNGQIGVVIPPVPVPQDNDQNPEYPREFPRQ